MNRVSLIALSAAALAAACGQQATDTSNTQTASTEAPMQSAAPAPAPAPATLSNADFVQQVANADAFEVQSSRLAAQHASDARVKTFATHMIHDHTATTRELTRLAPTINLPAPTGAVDSDHQSQLTSLQGKTGHDFDNEYLDDQTHAHQAAVDLFQRYINGAQEGPLRAWAQTTLPKLQGHLTDVQAIDHSTT